MSQLPRLAVGTLQQDTDATAILWALYETLGRAGWRVQPFLAQACFAKTHRAALVTGASARHLDSWLMKAATCREMFSYDASPDRLAIVQGTFFQNGETALQNGEAALQNGEAAFQNGDGADACGVCPGGDLETLCRWLDLPRLVILDVGRLEGGRLEGGRFDGRDLPPRPAAVDGLLLDGVADRDAFLRLQSRLEAAWGVPVVGGLESLTRVRSAICRLPSNVAPPAGLVTAVANNFSRYLRMDRLRQLAMGRAPLAVSPRLFVATDRPSRVRVAVAHDEAFDCYFPAILDVLEMRGAELNIFSPLKDESLPANTDVVYFGCGSPERYARELGDNSCMVASLQDHLHRDRRIYAEGGGLAYLCEAIEMSDSRCYPMSGVLPAVARINPLAGPPEPVELTLRSGSWLGEGWSRIRGYRDPKWQLAPTGRLIRYAAESGHELDLVGCNRAVGSRIHIDFTAQPDYLESFLAVDDEIADPRGVPLAI